MDPLDEAQVRELERRLAAQPRWARSRPRRVVVAVAVAVAAGAEGSLIALIDPEVSWLVPALAFGFLALAVGLALALMDPDRLLELSVRNSFPSAAALRRGEIAFQRDGGRIHDGKPKQPYWPQ